jgi:hypothetical protein
MSGKKALRHNHGVDRSFRDREKVAYQAAPYCKQRHAADLVEVRVRGTGGAYPDAGGWSDRLMAPPHIELVARRKPEDLVGDRPDYMVYARDRVVGRIYLQLSGRMQRGQWFWGRFHQQRDRPFAGGRGKLRSCQGATAHGVRSGSPGRWQCRHRTCPIPEYGKT